jgi:phage tail sheath gpL-like
MTQSAIPSNLRRPGAFQEFVFTAALSGLVPLPLRVALVGMKSAAGTAAVGEPVQIFDSGQADALFGVGSELALMARKALDTATRIGRSPAIWAAPINAPAGTAAEQTIMVTAVDAEAGDMLIEIAGRLLRVGVSRGDDAATIATAIGAALAERQAELPVTAAVTGAEVRCTHVTAGENGNDVAYRVVATPRGVSLALAQAQAGVGVADITEALDNLLALPFDGIAWPTIALRT